MRPLLPYLVYSFTAALFLTSGPLDAQTSRPTPLGSGGDKCGTWGAARFNAARVTRGDARITQAALFEEWLRGFVSGAMATNPTMKQTDSKTAGAFVDGYCKEHPARTLLDAATALVRDLSGAGPAAQD